MAFFLFGAVLAIVLIPLTVSLITGDFDYSGNHPERRDIYRRWRRPRESTVEVE